MARDKPRRESGPRGIGPTGDPIHLVETFFGRPWAEIRKELDALRRLDQIEVAAWEAWQELGLALRRIEHVAFDPDFDPEAARPRGIHARARQERKLAELAGARPRPGGHPGLHNRRYLQAWIAEFSPERLLEWQGDDAAHALRRLREELGDEATDRLEDRLKAAPSALCPLPEHRMLGEGHILPWLVLVLEVGALPVPTEKRAPSRIVAAAYSLLTGDKSELAQIARRVDEERRRYRENKAKVIRGAPRWPQRGKATP